MEIGRAGLKRLREGRYGESRDRTDVHKDAGGKNGGRCVERGCDVQRAAAAQIVEKHDHASQVHCDTHQRDGAGGKGGADGAVAKGPARDGGNRRAERDQQAVGDVRQLVHDFDAGACNQHAASDQRRGVTEHPVEIPGFDQCRNSRGKKCETEQSDTQRIGNPENEAERGGDDPAAKDNVDDECEHGVARPPRDLGALSLGQDTLRDERVCLNDMWHVSLRITLNTVHIFARGVNGVQV